MKKVLVILADGFEEIEAVTVVDILRRAEIDTVTCALKEGLVESARGVRVQADTEIIKIDANDYDMIVLPGGLLGAKNIDENEQVRYIVEKYNREERFIAAICAAPYMLAKSGLIKDCMMTCYPTYKGIVEQLCDYQVAEVVVDEHIITSRGPATAPEFAFTLVELLKSEAAAQKLREAMLYDQK
ncbi:MAG: DJ-1 family glyoxalase III [Deferribacterales bacterium]